jgi:hypothetical protein
MGGGYCPTCQELFEDFLADLHARDTPTERTER